MVAEYRLGGGSWGDSSAAAEPSAGEPPKRAIDEMASTRPTPSFQASEATLREPSTLAAWMRSLAAAKSTSAAACTTQSAPDIPARME